MQLPPRPEGSQITVVSEASPLTLEWRSQADPPWWGWAFLLSVIVGASATFAIVASLLLGLLSTFPRLSSFSDDAWSFFISLLCLPCLILFASTAYPLYAWIIRRFAPDPGRARLLVMPDALLWIEGHGRTSRVISRSDVLECVVDRQFGWCFLQLKSGWIPLGRSHAVADRDWLGEVLRRWHSGAA